MFTSVKVMVRPSDIESAKKSLIRDPVTMAIQRALDFPPLLCIGEKVVLIENKEGRKSTFALPPIAFAWRTAYNCGHAVKPVIFYLIPRIQ